MWFQKEVSLLRTEQTIKETFKKLLQYFLDGRKRQENAVEVNNNDSEWVTMIKK